MSAAKKASCRRKNCYFFAMPNDARSDLRKIFSHNRAWAARQLRADPGFFEKLVHAQVPEFLWIGCSDSRVPANEIIGLTAGEVFVHRNVANLISLTDFNCLSVIQYAVEILRVRHIIVCGHYGCGGVQSALGEVELGLVSNWLSPINELYEIHRDALGALVPGSVPCDKLCELNVITQVRNLCRSAPVRGAWHRGQPLAVHGLIYGLQDGILHDLNVNIVSSAMSEAVCHMGIERILATPGRVVD